MNTKTEEILKELNKIIVGKEAVLEKTLMAILSRVIFYWMTFPEWERPRWHLHALKY